MHPNRWPPGWLGAIVDQRFAASAFSQATDAVALAQELEAEVARLIRPVVEAAMADVAAQLNALGHTLADENVDEGVCYESTGEGGSYLYLCYDGTVSAGIRSGGASDST
jgi:hypothetical protein